MFENIKMALLKAVYTALSKSKNPTLSCAGRAGLDPEVMRAARALITSPTWLIPTPKRVGTLIAMVKAHQRAVILAAVRDAYASRTERVVENSFRGFAEALDRIQRNLPVPLDPRWTSKGES